jgi:predicted Zn-dependent protease
MNDFSFEIADVDDAFETPAEALGMTPEVGRAIASLAAEEAGAGRTDSALSILEGLVVTNPLDHAAWALLASVEKRRGRPLAARICAGVAHRLAHEDRQVRLARAEVLLAHDDAREEAKGEIGALAAGADAVAARAAALLVALGVRAP